jgi:hypothetical protein
MSLPTSFATTMTSIDITKWWKGEHDPNEQGAENDENIDLNSARSEGPSKMSQEERMMERRRMIFGGPGVHSKKKEAKKVLKRAPPRPVIKVETAPKASTEPAIPAEPAELVDAQEPRKPKWERLRAGMKLRVWWDGCEEYYDCKVIDWRVSCDEDKNLQYTHRCQYPGGVIEHDLSVLDFELAEGEVLEPSSRGADEAASSPDKTAVSEPSNVIAGFRDPQTPRRKWLARQEAEELEAYMEEQREELAPKGQRGLEAMRRVRQRMASQSKSTRPVMESPIPSVHQRV